MAFDWSTLRAPAPAALVAARELGHRAAQWPARAARANLAPVSDDSHTSLSWDAGRAALLSQPLPGGARVGLRVATLELLFVRAETADTFALAGKTHAEVGAWLDAMLAQAGLRPASGARLPYDVPTADPGKAAESSRLAALGRWYAAAAELLEAQRGKYRRFNPGPGPVRCWPHHFDIAILVGLEKGDAESARSIGIGVSPGDAYYAEPYAYVSPYPRPETAGLPPLPPPGRWHTEDFFAAVATATDVVALDDPRAGLTAIIDAAFDIGLRRLHV
jgi:hypothetical protein